MQRRSKQEIYRSFLEFIRADSRRERNLVSRRMRSVFFWCFILPALLSVLTLILIRLNVIPFRIRSYLDWVILIFPVSYSIYFISSEVIREVPVAFRSGGLATSLGQSLKEGEWRDLVCEGMRKSISASAQEWQWIVSSFHIDLLNLRYRSKYLTALAGAVFFLLMQGIDSITGQDDGRTTWVKDSALGWLEIASNDTSQFVGLALFLVLLYLSGIQTYHSLQRYLDCAELVSMENGGGAAGKGITSPRVD